ncbi:hypothetical protein HYH03_003602 [Edaphochlamys debaryana]|uniref:Uncharacterized protein n=1 Tax=Edaphochlamys debaryana TaxID=47281 RepID=A0A836C3Z6_9CHLO|nr:hypothetical protein HYH03_003602 [Edaphochlamys debaryana]|eukprot:KAG2498343.1 hypothetical protein HYH03_003602 [Edaphochlamys debaryana]
MVLAFVIGYFRGTKGKKPDEDESGKKKEPTRVMKLLRIVALLVGLYDLGANVYAAIEYMFLGDSYDYAGDGTGDFTFMYATFVTVVMGLAHFWTVHDYYSSYDYWCCAFDGACAWCYGLCCLSTHAFFSAIGAAGTLFLPHLYYSTRLSYAYARFQGLEGPRESPDMPPRWTLSAEDVSDTMKSITLSTVFSTNLPMLSVVLALYNVGWLSSYAFLLAWFGNSRAVVTGFYTIGFNLGYSIKKEEKIWLILKPRDPTRFRLVSMGATIFNISFGIMAAIAVVAYTNNDDFEMNMTPLWGAFAVLCLVWLYEFFTGCGMAIGDGKDDSGEEGDSKPNLVSVRVMPAKQESMER